MSVQISAIQGANQTISTFSFAEMDTMAIEIVAKHVFELSGACWIETGLPLTNESARAWVTHSARMLCACYSSAHKSSKVEDLSITSRGTAEIYAAMSFDQQNTTQPHLDGGPEGAVLLLGYEPSDVGSALHLFDACCCARTAGVSMDEYISGLSDRHNNHTYSTCELLPSPGVQPHATFRVLIVNNSVRDDPSLGWKSVLHQAVVPQPDASKRRVLHAIHLAIATASTTLTDEALDAFVATGAAAL